MDADKALSTLTLLANGIDPNTGEMLDVAGPYQTPEVIRALFVAVHAVQGLLPKERRVRTTAPNAGKSWTDAEDEQLLSLFDAGSDLQTIASRHGRTIPGVQARLERHGRLTARAPWRPGTAPTSPLPPHQPHEPDVKPTG